MNYDAFMRKVRKMYPIFRVSHKKPCRECPFRTVHPAGWLGPDKLEDYEFSIVKDLPISCHLTRGRRREPAQCAGAAILYKNELRSPRPLDFNMVVGQFARSKDVFSRLQEFLEHHRTPLDTWIKEKRKKKEKV